MRLHRLEIEAFGPFADRTVVDLDGLSEAGLFLLSGPTGAGKSSILDAVCFALYGDVPGDRSAAKRLRCDQAAAGVAPRVLLECTVGQRRFRLERSPAWERPKKRGGGLTTQQACVTLTERLDGEWVALSNRIDETGDLVRRVLGMSLSQFTQVAMLPQGRFQAFLRASSEERQQLLQQLFRTARFAEVERWLREHRLGLVRTDATTHQRVADLVSRLSETAGSSLPDGWDVHDLRPPADDDALLPWSRGLLELARADLARARSLAQDAVRDETASRTALESARAAAEQQRRLTEARRELAELEDRAHAHEQESRRVDAARRAAAVVPLLRHVAGRRSQAESAEARSSASLEAMTQHLEVLLAPGPTELEALAAQAAEAAALARAVLPRVERLGRARDELSQVGRQQERVERALVETSEEQSRLPSRVEELRGELETARTAAEEARELARSEHDLAQRLVAHAEVADLDARLGSSRGEWLAAREKALGLREEVLVVQQARIEGMAAELAGALASGCSCPVCGSAEHPAKAVPVPGAPDARAEKALRARADDASLVEHAFAAQVHELQSSLAAATARAGATTRDDVAAELTTVRSRRRTALATAGRFEELRAVLADLDARRARLDADLVDHESTRARLAAEQKALRSEIRAAESEVAVVLTSLSTVAPGTSTSTSAGATTATSRAGDGTSVPALLAHAELTESLARTAAADLARADDARREHDEALLALVAAAREAGFVDAADAAAQALDDGELRRLSATVQQHRDRLAVVRRLLADSPAEEAPADGDAVHDPGHDADLGQLEAGHRRALRRRDESAAGLHGATTRCQRLEALREELDDREREWRPLRADLLTATRLSSFVEGKSADNTLRMRLSAYVVAHRLSQVVAAANERLSAMSDHRYALEHTGHRGAGETRGGLSLLVRDDWSGEARDPATLSGGETFVVSLALALGLSDVVAHESGGAALDTLFVDEGFGSLDADTLDDVLDTLDALRDGGRVVGLVSHVAEMRDRIPTQLLIAKARGGSAVRHRLCGTMEP